MALSDDLRERVVGAVVEGGMSRNAAAKDTCGRSDDDQGRPENRERAGHARLRKGQQGQRCREALVIQGDPFSGSSPSMIHAGPNNSRTSTSCGAACVIAAGRDAGAAAASAPSDRFGEDFSVGLLSGMGANE